MSLKAELKGQTFGDLEVINYYKTDKWGSVLWECKCKCGATSYVRSNNLMSGKTTQCKFCAQNKHGMAKSKIYGVWQGMKTRCTNPDAINYHNYGGRGITYPSEWESFIGFYNDMSEGYKEGLTLERENNNLGYSKDNCAWVTPGKQNLNMRTNAMLSYSGKTQTLTEWGRELNIKRRTLYSLRDYHTDWTDKQIIEETLRREA
jgi:hypothetical protein